MILDVIQSKLATLKDMNSRGNIDCVKMDVILDELELLSKVLESPTLYTVKWVSDRKVFVNLPFDNITDGINIEF